MKKEEQLLKQITELVKATQEGKVNWQIECQTTEYNDEADKPVEESDGQKWTIDECFVSYECVWQDEEFLLISFEQIYTCGAKTRSCNMIFLPPRGNRYFDVDMLAPYAVPADKMLIYEVHMLWTTALEAYKKNPKQVKMDVQPRKLVLGQ